MKKRLLLTVILGASLIFAEAQVAGKKASLNADGHIELRNITIPEYMLNSSREMTVLEGFPFGLPANATFKNSRGVTLADLDNDGQEEIIFGADKTLYALNGDGSILWEKLLTGVITLPPAIADMDGDGSLEIVVNTIGLGALQSFGRVHLIDANGEEAVGWPLNFADHWMINAPAIADVDGDGIMEIITSERVAAAQGFLHVVTMDGEPLNDGWPVELTATPAFTPSVGDMNGDGVVDVITGTSSDGALRAYDANGNVLDGFPQMTASPSSLSYQSPLLIDITGNGNYEIVGSRHGENPEYYVVDSDGAYVEGWPVEVAGWTYSPPSVYDADGEGDYHIFMGHPNTSQDGPLDVLFGFNSDGTDLQNFPISKEGGNEGVITIADIDNNGVPDLIFTSNTFTLEDGRGFVHAYAMDGSGELEGFPLRTNGLTFLNSALLSDVNNDGNFDLTSLSYTQTFGTGVDSLFITAFDLGFEYIPENVYFNAYKGGNSRSGLISSNFVSTTAQNRVQLLNVFPNPSTENVQIVLPETASPQVQVVVFDLTGKRILEKNVNPQAGEMYSLDIKGLLSGVYVVQITTDGMTYVNKLVKE